MSGLYRKIFIAFMLLWLPLASGNAIASSIAMQMLHGNCDGASGHAMMDMGGHHGHAMHASMTHDHTTGHQHACHTCGVCQLACGDLMALPSLQVNLSASSRVSFHYLDAFKSNITVPLLPPPLVRV